MSDSTNRSKLIKYRSGKSGVALVIILSAIVFISILIALFLATTTLNRQLSFSSAGQSRAENIAQLGLETTIGDLRSEIVAGSTNSSVTPLIYLPVTNFTIAPNRVGNDGFTNLVKRSLAGSSVWSGSNYSSSIPAPIRASASSTITPSQNGRYVKKERWNAPYLLGPTLPTTFQTPDWILVMRQGAVTNSAAIPSMSVLSNPAATNAQFVIGRYAYTIYDEGGLIDINVAGFPTGVSTNFISRRGLLPQVDIANIPGIANARALLDWRNQASKLNYEQHVQTDTNGFTKVAPGDQNLVSRQDLINYAKNHSGEIELSALQYLATFNRSLNAPSFTPLANRKKVSAADDGYNPSLVDTRVTESFTRDSDGTVASPGDPLLKYRFPLQRLALFARMDPLAPALIEKYFGLTRADNKSPWLYRGGAASILKLSEVAAAKREPDFFELLQAGIAFGSLGKNLTGNASSTGAYDEMAPVQIAQIAANLIDQYDGDSVPTRIQLGGYPYEICGVENLPYLTRIYSTALRTPGADSTTNNLGFWYQAEIWNPHAQINLPSTAPSRFRFKATGVSGALFALGTDGGAVKTFTGRDLAESPGISFDRGADPFTQPTLLSPAMGATAEGVDDVNANGTHFVGIHVDTESVPVTDFDQPSPPTQLYSGIPSPYLDFELQYFDPVSNDYVTYDRIRRNNTGSASYLLGDLATPFKRSFIIRSDPRTDRFGTMQGYGSPVDGMTVRPTSGPGDQWSAEPFYIGLFSDNLSTSLTRYADLDGEIRPGDGAYAKSIGTPGYPLLTNNFTSRPVVLNRAFASVGEMGYASRGIPWKHLDFFHSLSGDAALLDLFCLKEPLTSSESEPTPEAGSVSLNSCQPAVIAALISGAMKAEDVGSVLSTTEANTFSQSLTALTTGTNGPLVNKSDLVSKWMPTLAAGASDTIIKRRKESIIRALADIGDTRTWNFLIDIVAQSGRYTTKAANLNDFLVEGERRYWLHVAIDRYTGKVIAQQLEQVNE